jgi:hypothetical protein
MEATRSSEKSVFKRLTRRHIAEGGTIHVFAVAVWMCVKFLTHSRDLAHCRSWRSVTPHHVTSSSTGPVLQRRRVRPGALWLQVEQALQISLLSVLFSFSWITLTLYGTNVLMLRDDADKPVLRTATSDGFCHSVLKVRAISSEKFPRRCHASKTASVI